MRIVTLDRSARVLDVAAGPGTLTFLAAPRVARVSAIDFSPTMIEELRARAGREGVGNVDAQVMDAQALTFADSTFDAAFCLFAFMFFPDRARAFREMLRVLRPGGKHSSPPGRRSSADHSFESDSKQWPRHSPIFPACRKATCRSRRPASPR
jgi:ubiquinone/menaquinone biosynthesis C-methylase UbiE